MPYIKHEYFHKGVYSKSLPDMEFMLKRPDSAEVKKWDDKNKKEVSAWLDKISNVFEKFIDELRESIK